MLAAAAGVQPSTWLDRNGDRAPAFRGDWRPLPHKKGEQGVSGTRPSRLGARPEDDGRGEGRLARVYEPVMTDLEAVRRTVRRWMAPPSPSLAEVFTNLQAAGGKLIRPALLLLAARAVGPVTEAHVAGAGAVELLHTASLIHDDILDGAELRRGAVSVRARWGASEAMVVGDVVFARAVELARRSGRPEVVRLVLAAARAVSAAELLHTHRRGDLGLSAQEYLHIARGKTASLFALAADLGAFLSAAEGPVRRRLYRYGRALGVAYQLADDCRDLVLDSPGVEGAVGLVRGCVTLPLICYLERCTREERDWVASVVRAGNGGGGAELQRRVLQSGACRQVRAVARRWLRLACGALEALPQSEAKSALMEAAVHVRGTFDELGQ